MAWRLKSRCHPFKPMKPLPEHLARGRSAENQALLYLQRKGLRLIDRNYRWRGGEIDLIMQDRECIVFVEVRLRKNDGFGGGLESIDHHKRQRLIQTALHYLNRQGIDSATRFDVIALSPAKQGLEVNWVRDAFQAAP